MNILLNGMRGSTAIPMLGVLKPPASPGGTYPVGGKTPECMGFYNMRGNVAEWVSDWVRSDGLAMTTRRAVPSIPRGRRRASTI
jgi:formylglycine-generating enzyme required for sulfatase activity